MNPLSRPIRILLVEDDPDDAHLIGEYLQEARDLPHSLAHVPTLREAEAHLRNRGGTDVVLLDLFLPDSSGLETLTRVLALTPEVSVVVLTGAADEGLAIEAIRAGAQDYLPKDKVTGPVLERVVRYAVERHRHQREREEALAALRQSESRFHRLVEMAYEGICILDAEGRLEYVNRRMARMLGYSVEEAIGRSAFEFIDAGDRDAVLERLERRHRGEPGEGEMRLRRADGSICWVLGSASPLPGPEDEPGGSFVVITDITERKETEEALRQFNQRLAERVEERTRELRESEAQFRTLANSIPQLAWMADAQGWIFWYNQRWYDYTGTTLEEMEGWGWRKVHHPEEVERVVERITHAFATGEPWEDTFPLRSRTGEYRWFLSRALPIRDEQGYVVRWFGTNTDVTEQMRAEERERALIHEQAAREAAEAAERREHLLADAGRILAASMDEKERLRAVARLMVPRLADWCVIDLLREDGSLESVEIVAGDPCKGERLRAMLARYPHHTSPDHHPTGGVLQSGNARLLADVSPEMLQEIATDETHQEMLRELAPVSSMMVPMTTHGRILGAITLTAAESGRHFDEADLALAEELGRRAALAVQNARLYQSAQRAQARTFCLQQITAALSEAVTPEEVAGVVVRQGVEATGAISGALVVLNEAGSEFQILRAEGLPEEVHAAWRHFPADAPTPVCDAVRSGEPLFFDSEADLTRAYPEFLAAVGARHSRSAAVVPMSIRSRPIGALVLGFAEWRAFSVGERVLLLSIARQAAMALERARLYERERRAVQARNELLGVVAHDLRNPLAAILFTAHLLEISLSPEEGAHARKIAALSERANRLIEDLLDVSRMEAGQLRMELLSVSVESLVNSAVDLLRRAAEEKGLALEAEVVGNAMLVRADPDRVAQVLDNLLGNALKVTPSGGRVTVQAEPRGSEVLFAVSDTGPGIAPEHLPHVFDRFWQEKRTTRGGAGLGLSIAKGIVEAHSGRIWAESKRGSGTTFYFTVPVAEAGSARTEEKADHRSDPRSL